MISKTKISLKYYWEAFGFINKNKLWWSYAIPIAFNTILLGLLVYCSMKIGSSAQNTLDRLILSYISIPESWAFIKNLVDAFIYIIVIVTCLMLYLFIFKFIIFILLGPFFSYIGDLAQNRLNGEQSKLSLKTLILSLKVSLIVNLRLLTLQSFWMILAYITMIIPILNLLSPFLLIIIEFYFSGASIINNNCERALMTKSQTTDFYKKNRAYLPGLGLGFWIIMLIPLIGWVIAPIIAVVASVLLYEKEKLHA